MPKPKPINKFKSKHVNKEDLAGYHWLALKLAKPTSAGSSDFWTSSCCNVDYEKVSVNGVPVVDQRGPYKSRDEADFVVNQLNSGNEVALTTVATVDSSLSCPFCGKKATSTPGRTLHVKSKHPDKYEEYIKGAK